jgi:peptidyl-dipeptidase Dcp
MAGNPDNVMQLVEQVWVAAKQSVEKERKQLESFIILQNTLSTNPSDDSKLDGTKTAEEGQQSLHHDHDLDHHVEIHPWDWRFYAEKVRKLNYDLDETEIKPYFSLTNMCQAIFDCANQLFNLDFILREDLEAYHPDVQVYEVREKVDNDNHQSRLVAIFLHDNYARPNKKGGAWMSEYRTQTKNTIIIGSSSDDQEGSHVVPIIVNNNNFNKPSPGEPCLLSFDDAVTLFHEFGHGLHGKMIL